MVSIMNSDIIERANNAFKIYQQLEAAIEQLNYCLNVVDNELYACAFELPLPLRGENLPQTIVPGSFFDKEARLYASGILRAFTLEPEQKEAATIRCPGVIACSAQTLKTAQRVNELKNEFKDAFKMIAPDKNGSDQRLVRHNAFARFVSFFSYRQTTRLLVIYETDILRIYFNWIKSDQSHRKTTVKGVIKRLRHDRQVPNDDIDIIDWQAMIDRELNTLSYYHEDTPLVYSKPIPPFPVANVYTPERQAQKSSRLFDKKFASLPVFYNHDVQKDEPPIKPLPVLDTRFKRVKRSDVCLKKEPLLSRIELFDYDRTFEQVVNV
jgi:hypothetical protein